MKNSIKQDLRLQCWEMRYFPKFFFNLYKCQSTICMWFIPMSSAVRIWQFLRQICFFSYFPISKVKLARSAQRHFEDKCSTGTTGFSQERAWKQCIKHIRINQIKSNLVVEWKMIPGQLFLVSSCLPAVVHVYFMSCRIR